jgi:capsule polysaccharide export protein KpsE/RkpR
MSMPSSEERSVLFDALKALAIVLYHWRFIVLMTTVAASVSAAVAFLLLKNEYKATVNAVPPRRTGSVLDNLSGNISSTLKDFGLTKLTGGKSDGYTQAVILESRRMQDTLIKLFQLAKEYDIHDTNMIDLRKELSEHLSISIEDEGNYTVSVWHTNPAVAAQMANKVIELGNYFATEIFQAEARVALHLLEKRYALDVENLERSRDSLLRFSRRYKLFSPLDQAKGAASALAELRLQRYKQELAADMATTVYGAQDPYTQAQRRLLEQITTQQQRAESQPGLAGDFALAGAGSDIALEYARLLADVEVAMRIKSILLPMIEQARQDVERTQPALYVLDPAVAPNKKDRPKRALIVGGIALGTLVLSAFFVLLRDKFLALRTQYRLVAQALHTEHQTGQSKESKEK